jgi:hypothetical protein
VRALVTHSCCRDTQESLAIRYSLAGFLIAGLLACDSSVAPSGGGSADQARQVTLRTDRTVYTASPIGGEGPYRTYEFTLVAQFTNGMSAPVYLERCYPSTPYPVYGIGSGAGARESAYDPVWACVGNDAPIVVLAGETRTDSLRVAGPNSWDGRTKEPFGDLAGQFRLSYGVGSCRAVNDCELPARVESNDFDVRLGP